MATRKRASQETSELFPVHENREKLGRVALGLAEIDPDVRADRIILADRVDGHAIEGKDGPIRLVIEGDLKPARSVRMVRSITVMRASEWGLTPASR